jgi:hypothetical protein
LSMIFSENRCTLFGIMLESARCVSLCSTHPHGTRSRRAHRHPLQRPMRDRSAPADGLSAAKRMMKGSMGSARERYRFSPWGPLRSGRVCRPSIPIFGCGGPIPSPEYPNVKQPAACLVPPRLQIFSRPVSDLAACGVQATHGCGLRSNRCGRRRHEENLRTRR